MTARKKIDSSLATFLVIVVISTALGFSLSTNITRYFVLSHSSLHSEIIALTLAENPQIYSVFRSPARSPSSSEEEGFFRDFLSLGKGFRVKVWARDGTIIWSDWSELIGQKFPDNEGFQEAMQGKPVYEIAELEKTENIEEKTAE